MQLTPGLQIDELRAVLRISEQRRQRAEARLADRERQLGTANIIIAAQDEHINELKAELATIRWSLGPLSRDGIDAPHENDASDALTLFSVYGSAAS